MASFGPLPPRSHLAGRPRRRLTVALRRQPVAFWALTALAAGSAHLGVAAATTTLAEGAAAYGDLVPVVVATRDLAPGDPVTGDEVTIADLPAGLVPAGAVADVPTGATARSPIVAGEAIVATRLAPTGSIGIAATLDPDERAIAIPTDRHRAPLEVGQRVDVLATVDPGLTAGRSPTTAVALDARVVDVAEGGITVAVPALDADRIATAMASAVVTVVVAPG